MVYRNETILQKKFSPDALSRPDSVLAISGVMPREWKPRIKIGSVWEKESQNGREYMKVKFDCFRTPAGKPLYAQLWPSKRGQGKLTLYADDKDVPCKSVHPLMPPSFFYDVTINPKDGVVWGRPSQVVVEQF